MFLPISGSPAPENLRSKFSSVLGQNPDSYKPIPIIHSLSLGASLSWSAATASMDEWIKLADASLRNTPFLWLGPTAAGHLKPPGLILNQGNNALWHYTVEMAKEARSRDLEALGMYNLTLQASSWDGSGYGQRVALVQAMIVSFCPLPPRYRRPLTANLQISGHQLAFQTRNNIKSLYQHLAHHFYVQHVKIILQPQSPPF